MRDPNRLQPFYSELARIHRENFPDWRFGQFINNFLRWLRFRKGIVDVFYLEESRTIELLKEYAQSKE